MAFARINYHSRSLQKASSVSVVFPDDPAIPRPWSVYYLLHGLSDDDTIWMRRTSIERYVEGLPLVVVMPDGGRGFYTNAVIGYAYEDDLIKDVVGLIDRTFPVKPERSGRAIGGLSMGGYGAVKIGLKHHAMFASVNSHSGGAGDPPGALRHRQHQRHRRRASRGSSARLPGGVPKTPSGSSRNSTTAAFPHYGSTAARATSCSTRTAHSTATWNRCKSLTSTKSSSVSTTGNTGTCTSRKRSRSMCGT